MTERQTNSTDRITSLAEVTTHLQREDNRAYDHSLEHCCKRDSVADDHRNNFSQMAKPLKRKSCS